MGTYTLYGAEISYYSGKARAYLRYKEIPFEEVASGRNEYRDVILPRVGWPVIPILVTPDDETLQDTSDIIDHLETVFPEAPVFPEGPRQRSVALLLEVYGDEWLKLPAMHYRWNHNTDWIIPQFGALSAPDADAATQREIGEKTCKPFRGSLPVLGVDATTIPAIEASYEALLGELDAHFAEHEFLFGSRPSIGDYGLIGPLYAHQYHDPASGALMERLAPRVVAWVKRMMDPKPKAGTFLPRDEVPATLLPVIERMLREQRPVLDATVAALGDWAAANPGASEVPRAIGMHGFALGAAEGTPVRGERAIFPFEQWMWQRPWDHFQGLDADAQQSVRDLLGRVGAPDWLDATIPCRLTRRDFKLVRA
ncbi:MAG: glutathione S-transferase [Myxococcota bacterium]